MASSETNEFGLGGLGEAGLTSEELARLRSPVGLDLGARTPEETAVAIAAELIQLRWGGSGKPPTSTEGRIPHDLRPRAPSRAPWPRGLASAGRPAGEPGGGAQGPSGE